MTIGRIVVSFAILISFVCVPAAADSFATNVGDATGPLVAVGIAATYLAAGEHNTAKAARVADAAVIAVGAAELIKPNINVDKHQFRHGFPSGHVAIAFGTATAMADVFPKQKWLLYAGAALVGWSRVESRAHSWGDVVGGAALGYGVGKWSMSSSDGLMLGRVYRF
ncbi:MAG: phosphatase PAP2 family protein [Armatimonadetes bacterium]|nr:phosphatase PAP2 family protein [Armatimonadota bacterium]